MSSRVARLAQSLAAAAMLLALPSLALAHNDEEPASTDGATSVPELSADGTAGGLALLVGGALLVADRRRKRA